MKIPAVLASVSSAVVAFGVGMVYVPAGVVAAGLFGVCAAYVVAYLGRGQ